MNKKRIVTVVGSVVIISAVFGIGHATGSTTKNITATRLVTRTVTDTVTKDVPGPIRTKTVYEPAQDGPAGTTIATYTGSGNEVTPSFGIPSSGDYIVSWTFSGNETDGMSGGDNFSISDTNNSGEAGNEPNVIAVSGSGSTEDTGMSGSQSFNIQATGSWTITVKTASS